MSNLVQAAHDLASEVMMEETQALIILSSPGDVGRTSAFSSVMGEDWLVMMAAALDGNPDIILGMIQALKIVSESGANKDNQAFNQIMFLGNRKLN